ncbi:histone H1 [Diachasma alloeum]|uniref:histone H1 n=1 Tax=Diachasma alloeum TaxID=454923 RepID=UPI0007382D49|nr:histone H1 [Diachasma alloeum]
MTDKVASPVVASATGSPAPAKAEVAKKATKAKNPKPKPTHPSTADMVNTAVKTLAERNGSSLQAIKKYIAANYKIDTTKAALFIKKYLKSAVAAGTLVQTKGSGASGSFKLPVKSDAAKPKSKPMAAKKEGPSKKAALKKPAKKVEAAKPMVKKAASAKKASAKKPAAEKAAKPKVAKAAGNPKSPKAKKATKGPTAKPKAPKPRKAAPSKAKAAAKK